ncbi:MAG TPA: hypothetical protein VNN07_12845 [Candidatus Tectomicrobia bacterium]|nr:hypothetical protein [Candidatus Tectomicrobia bacterium]
MAIVAGQVGAKTKRTSRVRPVEPAPRIVTVYIDDAGDICHTRCETRIAFMGVRARLELDFYCWTCREHVTLPELVLADIPARAPAR